MPVPAGCYWGVDSLLPTHIPIGGKASLLELVKEKANATPRFWGRYIGSHNGANALSSKEVDFLRAASPQTRLLLDYNLCHIAGDRAAGERDARKAIAAASALGVEGGVVIYANAEPDSGDPTSEWIVGWWETMVASKYVGGLYGNTSGGRAHLEGVYAAALRKVGQGGRPPVWAMYPLKGTKTPEEITFPYQPDPLKCAPTAAVVWQYAINCYKPNPKANGRIDMDLATQAGYEGMWKVGQTLFPPTDDEVKAMVGGWRD